jgi:hypothetical protein
MTVYTLPLEHKPPDNSQLDIRGHSPHIIPHLGSFIIKHFNFHEEIPLNINGFAYIINALYCEVKWHPNKSNFKEYYNYQKEVFPDICIEGKNTFKLLHGRIFWSGYIFEGGYTFKFDQQGNLIFNGSEAKYKMLGYEANKVSLIQDSETSRRTALLDHYTSTLLTNDLSKIFECIETDRLSFSYRVIKILNYRDLKYEGYRLFLYGMKWPARRGFIEDISYLREDYLESRPILCELNLEKYSMGHPPPDFLYLFDYVRKDNKLMWDIRTKTVQGTPDVEKLHLDSKPMYQSVIDICKNLNVVRNYLGISGEVCFTKELLNSKAIHRGSFPYYESI